MSKDTILSKRLKAVASYVPKGARLADIGSDHAYLPVQLVKDGLIDFAIAGEVVKGPFENAQKEVDSESLHNNIYVRLANGLKAVEIEDQVDCVVVAGMGGILISDILDDGLEKLDDVKTLVLQPNNHEEVLRSWLELHNFIIVKEEILLEAGKFYEIIVAQPGQVNLTELDKNYGPHLRKEKSSVFKQKWEKELRTLDKILARLPEERQEKRAEVMAKQKEIQELLK
ncbi:tRNA (adenine(22)-N(1))-methyltransferase [Lactococcus termiticola]|uniref:SAM-dependent methyltransferase n=1 Tax=Lactococcus termiticola TaxID=2169526 RepID=A0A2R5HG86_9LACT|nr:tRNA (adenine(22)-N(1))-methyltransferase TrmK [Lactococcus termiticola]GBG97077.1 SAM-dependent methyltransferase [Lactococcus termiticola]